WPMPPTGSLARAPEVYGYLLDGTSDASVGALSDLLQRGIAVRVSEKPFAVAGQAFGRGTLLIKREGNPDDLAGQLEEVAKRWGVAITATPTALAEDGPDLGGRHFLPLVAPRIGVWTGWPVSPSDYGSIWHLFDIGIDLRFSGLDLGRFASTDLRRYNVLVFPPARGTAYQNALGASGVKRLRQWIEAGGTAIGIGGGADFLADKDLDLTKTRARRQALDRYPPVVLGVSSGEVDQGGPLRASGIKAPEPVKDDAGEVKDNGKKKEEPVKRDSPYDIAPILGPGARPFAAGIDQGTPASPVPVDLATWIMPLLPSGIDKPTEEDLAAADERLRRFRPRGAFLRVDLDPENWVNWGLADEIPVWVSASDTFVAEPPVQVAARFPEVERLHLGGLLWPEAGARLARTAFATREQVGRGQVILFLANPVFRGWVHDSRRMFANSVLYGPGLGTDWSTPW
ncbi:MAG: hypothetical protein R3344_03885, partial [Acidobacteriota bacterium]|nr:hypothetical protein [Acidobacteriota bacterium]